MEYKIKPVSIEADGVADVSFPHLKDRVIEKTGATIEFTMRQLDDNMALLKKSKAEIEPVISHAKAKIDNVEHHHPKIKELTGEELVAAHMYLEAKDVIKDGEAKLQQIEDLITSQSVETLEIKAQIPEFTKLDEEEKKEEEKKVETKKKKNGKKTK